MASAEIKINRIKSANRGKLNLLGEVVQEAQVRIPKLAETAKNAVELRNIEESFSTLGTYCRKNGFDPTRSFQHVAKFDTEIWTLILEMFAKYDDKGQLMDDGLLYKYDPDYGTVRLNKDFFFALLSYFESKGIPCDMRGKITVA